MCTTMPNTEDIVGIRTSSFYTGVYVVGPGNNLLSSVFSIRSKYIDGIIYLDLRTFTLLELRKGENICEHLLSKSKH